MNYKVTIVGTGNAGCAHAAMFTLYGHSVTLFKSSKAGNSLNFDYLRRMSELTVTTLEGETKTIKLANVTDDPAVAFADCDICFVMVQTLYHKTVAEIIGKYAGHIKLLVVVPGYLGSLYFRDALGVKVDYIAEGESTAYDARLVKDGHVKILFKNVRNAIGILKGSTDEILPILQSLVETYQHVRKNVVDSALHNPNLIVHTVGTIVSAARIEYSHGEFWMYRESFTPSIWNIIRKLDEEKMCVLERFGCKRIPYVEACKFRNCEDLSVDAYEVFKAYAETGGPKGPMTVQSRYILEDVPMGLGLLRQLGDKCGVATPMCDALITMAGALVCCDFWRELREIGDFDLNSLM